MSELPAKRRFLTKMQPVVVVALLLVAAGFATIFYLNREPSYGGKSLSEWVDYMPGSGLREVDVKPEDYEVAKEAIRKIGPKSIPFLIDWLRPPAPPSRIREWTEHVLDWINEQAETQLYLPEKRYRGDEAYAVFQLLGPEAKTAIPALTKEMDENPTAAICLGTIGTNAIPTLAIALNSTNKVLKQNAIYGLGQMRGDPEASRLVSKFLSDPDLETMRAATLSLSQLGTANRYVPELVQLLNKHQNGVLAARTLLRTDGKIHVLKGLTNESSLIKADCLAALTHGVSRPQMLAIFLSHYLSDSDPAVRLQAIADLGVFGFNSWRLARPLSELATGDADEDVRQSAKALLHRINIECLDGGIVRGPRKEKKIALEFTAHTFAEGGETILDELAKHHAKASFFVTGDFLRNPQFLPLIRRIIGEGHYLGPHSDKHLLYCSWDAAKTNLVSHAAFTGDITQNLQQVHKFWHTRSSPIPFWLPAYEHYNQQIADWSAEMGLTLVNYTPGTRSNADYTQESDKNFVSSQAIFDSIVKKEREDPDGLNGFLLLMHLGAGPGRHNKMHARFGELLDYLSTKGYQFVRIDEMFGEDGGNRKTSNAER